MSGMGILIGSNQLPSFRHATQYITSQTGNQTSHINSNIYGGNTGLGGNSYMDLASPIYNPMTTPHYEVKLNPRLTQSIQNVPTGYESVYHPPVDEVNTGAPFLSPNPFYGGGIGLSQSVNTNST